MVLIAIMWGGGRRTRLEQGNLPQPPPRRPAADIEEAFCPGLRIVRFVQYWRSIGESRAPSLPLGNVADSHRHPAASVPCWSASGVERIADRLESGAALSHGADVITYYKIGRASCRER